MSLAAEVYTFPNGACEESGTWYLHPYSAACNCVILGYLTLFSIQRRWQICRAHAACILCQCAFEVVHLLCHLRRGALGGYCFISIHTAGLAMTTSFAAAVRAPWWQFVSYASGDLALFAIGAPAHVHALFIFAHITLFAGTAVLRGAPLLQAAGLTAMTAGIYAMDSMFCEVLRSWSKVFPWHTLVEVGGLFVFASVNRGLYSFSSDLSAKKVG